MFKFHFDFTTTEACATIIILRLDASCCVTCSSCMIYLKLQN